MRLVTTGFRQVLQAELVRRCAANPKYSLRALARRLDIHPATLCQLIGGQRTLTAAMIRRLGVRLGVQWLPYAILELTHARSFRADSRWISRELDVSADEVNVCIQNLARLTLLQLAGERWLDQSAKEVIHGSPRHTVADHHQESGAPG